MEQKEVKIRVEPPTLKEVMQKNLRLSAFIGNSSKDKGIKADVEKLDEGIKHLIKINL